MQSGLDKTFAASSKEQSRNVEAAQGLSKSVCAVSLACLLFIMFRYFSSAAVVMM